jgi:hypothetical protein
MCFDGARKSEGSEAEGSVTTSHRCPRRGGQNAARCDTLDSGVDDQIKLLGLSCGLAHMSGSSAGDEE